MSTNRTPMEPRPDACPTGSGTGWRGYQVEVRYNHHEPCAVGGKLFDNRWQQLHWSETEGRGIPRPPYIPPALILAHLLSYEEAQAQRWLFLCLASAEVGALGQLCFESRLVEVEVEYSYKAQPVAWVSALNSFGDIPDDMRPTPKAEVTE